MKLNTVVTEPSQTNNSNIHMTEKTEPVAQNESEAELKEEPQDEKVEELSTQQKLFYYCKKADIEGIKSIASQIQDINARDESASARNPYISQNTALHYSVLSGSLETVKVIYNLEARLDSVNKLRSTPLHLAASLGYTEICDFLIKMKAEIEAKNKIKNTPLHCAVYAGHVETVKCILNHVDDKRDALLAVNGVNFSAVKYTAHDSMKQYLRTFFPKKQQNYDDRQEEEEEEEEQYAPKYNGSSSSSRTSEIVEEEEEVDADETTGLKSGTATATEQ